MDPTTMPDTFYFAPDNLQLHCKKGISGRKKGSSQKFQKVPDALTLGLDAKKIVTLRQIFV